MLNMREPGPVNAKYIRVMAILISEFDFDNFQTFVSYVSFTSAGLP